MKQIGLDNMQDGGARLVKACGLVGFALLTHAASANAQARDDDSVAGDVFLGAAFLVWTATNAPEDTSSFAGVAYSGAAQRLRGSRSNDRFHSS
jgi:hypothetical protein